MQLQVGGYTLSTTTTANVAPHPPTSEINFRLYRYSPIGFGSAQLNNELRGNIGDVVQVVMEIKVLKGEKLVSNSAKVRIMDTWSGYESGKSRAWLDIPVDLTTGWSEMVNAPGSTWDLTWSDVSPYNMTNETGRYRNFYKVIKTWNTMAEPFTEYLKQGTVDTWVHFSNPIVGHNGEQAITVVEANNFTSSGLSFQHYDEDEECWLVPTEVAATVRKATISNLVVTSLKPGNGTIDYIKYDPDPEGKYHRPTLEATFADTNHVGQNHHYVCYWMLLATANPVERELLDVDDANFRADSVINAARVPTVVNFTWQGHVGEIDIDNPPFDVEYDVATYGTYTYDVDVVELDENWNFVDWHSYKWPSCLSIGEHTITATDNEDESGSTLNYTYVLHDIANEDTTGYYPNLKDPSQVQMVVIDINLEEQNTIDLNMQLDGQTRGGIGTTSSEGSSVFVCWRTVYIGQDNCWKADRRDHESSRLLAVNKEFGEKIDLPVPYIAQNEWNGSEWVMHSGWCSRASQAMVIAYFERDKSDKVVEIVDHNSKFLENHPIRVDTIRNLTGKDYVGSNEANTSKYKVLQSLYNGNPVIVYTRGIYTYNHIFVLRGYDPKTDTFYANDTFGSAARSEDIKEMHGTKLTWANVKAHLKSQTAGQCCIYVPTKKVEK